jgi:hypothetical protein
LILIFIIPVLLLFFFIFYVPDLYLKVQTDVIPNSNGTFYYYYDGSCNFHVSPSHFFNISSSTSINYVLFDQKIEYYDFGTSSRLLDRKSSDLVTLINNNANSLFLINNTNQISTYSYSSRFCYTNCISVRDYGVMQFEYKITLSLKLWYYVYYQNLDLKSTYFPIANHLNYTLNC